MLIFCREVAPAGCLTVSYSDTLLLTLTLLSNQTSYSNMASEMRATYPPCKPHSRESPKRRGRQQYLLRLRVPRRYKSLKHVECVYHLARPRIKPADLFCSHSLIKALPWQFCAISTKLFDLCVHQFQQLDILVEPLPWEPSSFDAAHVRFLFTHVCSWHLRIPCLSKPFREINHTNTSRVPNVSWNTSPGWSSPVAGSS